ncbi:hypothetical protein FHETE_6942 [Fusarium heterosporum]|uniref:3CxxC-type domain-containing protein n=1 Tax=Fusarium heterosporum TaxID=42747 RepID=A0A8H5T812_FUSHE|nr:hypothetical protein FHETE_6942 [Fusarium heterosporum]
MPRRRLNEDPLWSLYPELHDEVADKLEEFQLEYSFNTNDDEHSILKDYDSNIMGRFSCPNDQCKNNGWSTEKMAVTIREYSGDRYNVRVYHQRCKRCKSVGRPTIDEDSYIDRVTYRIKKWNGVEMKHPEWSGIRVKPHEEALCEGCRDGHCLKDRKGGIEWA